MYHGRHWFLLTVIALCLTVTADHRPPLGAPAYFALFGALHAGSVTATLRQPASWTRRAPFIALSAAVSGAVTLLALLSHKAFGACPVGSLIDLSVASAGGALIYSRLLGSFFGLYMSLAATLTVSAACAFLTVMVFRAGWYTHGFGLLWFALPWWAVMSAALRLREPRRRPEPAR